MVDAVYCYPPECRILRNKFGIRDAKELSIAERECVLQRSREEVPNGQFDLHHLRMIHKHLFQDVYEWAGQTRVVSLEKDGHVFQPPSRIETGMSNVHHRLVQSGYLRGMNRDEFARQAGQIIGDVNYVHPFREGNGRAQLQYLNQLAGRAGHSLDLTKLDRAAWIAASKEAHDARYEAMGRAIAGMIREPVRTARVAEAGRPPPDQKRSHRDYLNNPALVREEWKKEIERRSTKSKTAEKAREMEK